MLRRFLNWIAGLFNREPVRLAIVRRYVDANGSYVGELYMEYMLQGMSGYRMIGMSLDSMPLEYGISKSVRPRDDFELDTAHDFLARMPGFVVRVGALDPADNDRVRRMVAALPQGRMTLVVQNRFIEHVMDKKPV